MNASGRKAVQEEFVRYGFPSWWCWITAILEFLTALLLVLRPTFAIGVMLGACIMVAAILAAIRARDFRHIPPPFGVPAAAHWSGRPARSVRRGR
ncbi:hypothetical protein B5P46_01735 [Rhizobium leguminosarum]|uniref:DoxX family protein n=1 Tax=Rhizobium leguminosarum TaxID=384 RepID=A0A4Q1UCP8_RHILE|nr:hypothetical protein B5P46_01735 [Rhizobium leguminosarum]